MRGVIFTEMQNDFSNYKAVIFTEMQNNKARHGSVNDFSFSERGSTYSQSQTSDDRAICSEQGREGG